MTRKKFIKRLMAAGAARNTAAEAATVTAWQGKVLDKTLGHLLTIRAFIAFRGSKHLVADFEREILRAARIVKLAPPPWQRIRPLAGRKKIRARHDGYRAMYFFIDEMDKVNACEVWPKENPHLPQPVAEFLQKPLHIPQQGGAGV